MPFFFVCRRCARRFECSSSTNDNYRLAQCDTCMALDILGVPRLATPKFRELRSMARMALTGIAHKEASERVHRLRLLWTLRQRQVQLVQWSSASVVWTDVRGLGAGVWKRWRRFIDSGGKRQ